MSFYVWDCPEVSEKLKGIFTSHSHFYVFHDKWTVFKNDYKTEVGKAVMNQLLHENFSEYKLHPKQGFVPAYYNEIFLDNAPESWSSDGSPEEMETKQQNEKSDQKEENENMGSKEEFPVVGQKVVIDPNMITYCLVLKDCLGREVIVIAKYKYYNIDMASVCLDEFSGVACVRVDCCFPTKTEREEEIENIAGVLYASEGDYLKSAQYLYAAGLRFK